MDVRRFEDWKVGDRIETMSRTVGDAEISQFVALGGLDILGATLLWTLVRKPAHA